MNCMHNWRTMNRSFACLHILQLSVIRIPFEQIALFEGWFNQPSEGWLIVVDQNTILFIKTAKLIQTPSWFVDIEFRKPLTNLNSVGRMRYASIPYPLIQHFFRVELCAIERIFFMFDRRNEFNTIDVVVPRQNLPLFLQFEIRQILYFELIIQIRHRYTDFIEWMRKFWCWLQSTSHLPVWSSRMYGNLVWRFHCQEFQ